MEIMTQGDNDRLQLSANGNDLGSFSDVRSVTLYVSQRWMHTENR